MLVQLLYVSRAVGPQTTAMTSAILSTAQLFNKAAGITGVLCQGQGFFLQWLEGQRSAVNQLYSRILVDKRHQDVEILHFSEIAKRGYPDWSMAHVNLSDADSMVKMHHPEFDPYAASGEQAIRLIQALVESGQPIKLPVL